MCGWPTNPGWQGPPLGVCTKGVVQAFLFAPNLFLRRLEKKSDVRPGKRFERSDYETLDDNVPVNFVVYEKFGRSGIRFDRTMFQVSPA